MPAALPACAVRCGGDSCHRLVRHCLFTCCASSTQSCQTKPEMHKLLLLLRVWSATGRAAKPGEFFTIRSCDSSAKTRRRHRTQSVHDLMHENTMTDATAVLISGSSHTASCQLNGMKILPLASRIEHVSISVCCPPPTRLQKGSSTDSYTADAMVLDLDNLQQPRSDSARNETFFVTDLAAGDNASNHRIS